MTDNDAVRAVQPLMRAALGLLIVQAVGGVARALPLEQENTRRTEVSSPGGETGEDERGDLICGPRCVQYVLRRYGQDADLIELAREIQWPDLEAGASLQSMEKCLRERGIHTFGMQLAPQARLKWPYPVVVHLNVGSGGAGHYVVWLPSSSGRTVDVWYGLEGPRRESERELARRRSGAVLLTSPVPIRDPDSAVELGGLRLLPWFCVGVGCLLLLGTLRLRKRSR